MQGWGRVGGYPWYFRARGESWSFEIIDDKSVDPPVLPILGHASGWEIEATWDSRFEAIYMPEDVAWVLIAGVIAAFRQGTSCYLHENS